MTDEKVSTTFQEEVFKALRSGLPAEREQLKQLGVVAQERLIEEQEEEERRHARREYVEAMREGWRRKHGWRNQ